MRLALRYWFSTVMICLFFSVIVLIVSIKWIGIIAKDKILIYLVFFIFRWIISHTRLISRISLLKFWQIIGISIRISNREINFPSIFRFMCIHSFPLFILMYILRLSSFIIYIKTPLLSKPKGKCAFLN